MIKEERDKLRKRLTEHCGICGCVHFDNSIAFSQALDLLDQIDKLEMQVERADEFFKTLLGDDPYPECGNNANTVTKGGDAYVDLGSKKSE